MYDDTAKVVIQTICADRGNVRPTAALDILDLYKTNAFQIGKLNEFLDKVESEGSRPHWFFPKPGSDDALEREAFGPNATVTKQGEYQKRFPADFQAAAERWQNPAAKGVYGKPGVDLDKSGEGAKSRQTNPFSCQYPGAYDDQGRITAVGRNAMMNMVKGMGEKVTAEIGARVGGKLGQTHAPDFKKDATYVIHTYRPILKSRNRQRGR
jgi:hypothetical protein